MSCCHEFFPNNVITMVSQKQAKLQVHTLFFIWRRKLANLSFRSDLENQSKKPLQSVKLCIRKFDSRVVFALVFSLGSLHLPNVLTLDGKVTTKIEINPIFFHPWKKLQAKKSQKRWTKHIHARAWNCHTSSSAWNSSSLFACWCHENWIRTCHPVAKQNLILQFFNGWTKKTEDH